MPGLLQVATQLGTLTQFLHVMKISGQDAILTDPGAHTVFAPTDDAFAALPADELKALLHDPPRLEELIKYHILSGRYLSEKLANMETATTLDQQELGIRRTRDHLAVDDANVLQADLEADNGVLYIIDRVLNPWEAGRRA